MEKELFRKKIREVISGKVDKKHFFNELTLNKETVELINYAIKPEKLCEGFFEFFEADDKWLYHISDTILECIIFSDTATEKLKHNASKAYIDRIIKGKNNIEKAQNLIIYRNKGK